MHFLSNSGGEILSPKTFSHLITIDTVIDESTGEVETRNLHEIEDDFIYDLNDYYYPIGTILPFTSEHDLTNEIGGTWQLTAIDSALIGQGIGPRQGGYQPKMITLADGSVWDLILFQDIANGGLFSAGTAAYNVDLNAEKTLFSKMTYIDDYFCNASNKVELMLAYNMNYNDTSIPVATTARWRQTRTLKTASTATGLSAILTENPTSGTDATLGCFIPSGWAFTGLKYVNETAAAFRTGDNTFAVGTNIAPTTAPATLFTVTSIALFARADINYWYCQEANVVKGVNTVTLTIDQLPYHTHKVGRVTLSGGTGQNDEARPDGIWSGSYTAYTGGGGAHNNMQPWQTVYYYERIE